MECLWLAGRSWCSPWESPPRSQRCPRPAAAGRAAAGTGNRSKSGPPPPRTPWGPPCPSSAPCRRARWHPWPAAPPASAGREAVCPCPWRLRGWVRAQRAGPRARRWAGWACPGIRITEAEQIWKTFGADSRSLQRPQGARSRGGVEGGRQLPTRWDAAPAGPTSRVCQSPVGSRRASLGLLNPVHFKQAGCWVGRGGGVGAGGGGGGCCPHSKPHVFFFVVVVLVLFLFSERCKARWWMFKSFQFN